ncbi:MAG: LamG domain-containing protein, partial [Spirochaetales bacterium]|nr:LamG domain-containing protein [Spirochaetales bacterium]
MKYIILLLMLITSFLPALSRDLSLRGNDSWGKIEEWNNIELYPGKGDFGNLGIKSSIYPSDTPETDLLIHFDNSEIIDSTDNYKINSYIKPTDIDKTIGNMSGAFRGFEKSLILYPKEGSLFAPGNLIDSFTIEFWLKPSRFSEDAVIFAFTGTTRDEKGNIIPQELLSTIKDRKLTWEFKNFFYSPGEETSITLTGLSSIIPDVWHHHLIRFNSSTGLIEYLVDGKPEGIKYSTPSGNEDETVYFPLISSQKGSTLILGKNLTGFMDEVRVSRTFVDTPVINRYQTIKGNIVSQTINLGRAGSKLEKIVVNREIPSDSAI